MTRSLPLIEVLSLGATLALASQSLANNFGPGNQSLTGPPTTSFNVNAAGAWVDTRFTALNSGDLSSFAFGSIGSNGYANNDPTAFFVDIYTDDGSGGLGAMLGTSSSVQFNNTGGRARSANFTGISVTAGQNYHAVVKSTTASATNNFSIAIAQPGFTNPRVESFDMNTANPGFRTRTTANSGGAWTTISSNGITTHSVVINGLKQGYAYTGNTSGVGDPGRIYNDGATQQFLSQAFTFDTYGAGAGGGLSSVTMGLRGNTTGPRDVLYRLAEAGNLSNIIAEKTVTYDFPDTTNFYPVAADFSGTTLLNGTAYALFAGQANDNDSTASSGFIFTRPGAWGLGAPDFSTQTFQGNASFAGITSSMASLPASGILSGTRVDYGFLIQYSPIPEPTALLEVVWAGTCYLLAHRRGRRKLL